MFAHISGILKVKQSTEAVIDCNGIGYSLLISLNTNEKLPQIGSEVCLKTLLVVRDDQISFYGFIDDNERDLFKMLTSVSGIGGKTALGILSSVTADELVDFISNDNLFALQKMPGIGKKTAERLLVELRDKIGKINIKSNQRSISSDFLVKSEAISAMITLGYSKNIAEKAIEKAIAANSGKNPDAELIIKDALKFAMQ